MKPIKHLVVHYFDNTDHHSTYVDLHVLTHSDAIETIKYTEATKNVTCVAIRSYNATMDTHVWRSFKQFQRDHIVYSSTVEETVEEEKEAIEDATFCEDRRKIRDDSCADNESSALIETNSEMDSSNPVHSDSCVCVHTKHNKDNPSLISEEV